jgi:hypothetical protein
MSRSRIEGLLAAFPKLVGSGESSTPSTTGSAPAASSRQHTFVETENVRYVYLPVEALYLLLITNKNSNIIEDLDTLRLLSKVIPETVGVGVPVSDETVSARAFELLFAFDEVVASGGYREDVTLHQIRTNLEMESHEERLAQMIKASKMAEAKEAAKRRAQEIRERNREDERLARAGLGGASSSSRMSGFGSGSGSPGSYGGGGGGGDGSGSRYGGIGSSSYEGGGGSSSSSSSSSAAASSSGRGAGAEDGAPKRPAGSGAGGMKLGSKKAGGLGGAASGAFASVIAEEGIRDKDLALALGDEGAGGALAAVQAAKAAAEAASADQATIVVEERVNARISRDGGCQAYEVKGSLSLTVVDEAAARLKVAIQRGDDRAFAYQSHPNINKPALGGPNGPGIIALKQSDRPFPTGAPVGVLRWRYAAKDDDSSQLPLMITCWPEEGAGGVYTVNVEYTLQREDVTLTEVIVTVPL